MTLPAALFSLLIKQSLLIILKLKPVPFIFSGITLCYCIFTLIYIY